ncbi:predicted protein [Sclerotinia sclerotiorum 1980 UF-70]|uniref:Uncharacterized protein n=2 Tax=Sclerotinia sclerotiorum (strain ATCC 18683 / 1980 / Ss-1) TaxID=665079 RepID=A7F404_SCLS1|nr:predicted protein [Sclerotinia sclerotiorum 1980 UF-70]APA14216.1 hypothetical protein sscle_12g089860 [Sclerotinia sclerotiorum 1980 UF-70]EDN97475.1 predicted protein [Sclerotinia sclerotiorum 1980 UF-70]
MVKYLATLGTFEQVCTLAAPSDLGTPTVIISTYTETAPTIEQATKAIHQLLSNGNTQA